MKTSRRDKYCVNFLLCVTQSDIFALFGHSWVLLEFKIKIWTFEKAQLRHTHRLECELKFFPLFQTIIIRWRVHLFSSMQFDLLIPEQAALLCVSVQLSMEIDGMRWGHAVFISFKFLDESYGRIRSCFLIWTSACGVEAGSVSNLFPVCLKLSVSLNWLLLKISAWFLLHQPLKPENKSYFFYNIKYSWHHSQGSK